MAQVARSAYTYDDFTAVTLDRSRWSVLEFPRHRGRTWRCEDPSARIEVGEGTLDIHVGHFTRGHDRIQMFDNLKHHLVSTRLFHAPVDGQVTYSLEMAATNLNSSFYDWRDGQATFMILDPRTGWSFRSFTTSHQIFAIHGPMRADSTTTPDSIIDWGQPWLSVHPGVSHRHDITLDFDEQSIWWQVDKAPVCYIPHSSLPSEVRLGLGITTLQPILEGRSQSSRGQGLSASFGPITIFQSV
jgi:Family of unknown function (DUF6081)